jgi:hypothetical protein
MDLVDAEDDENVAQDPAYLQTFVYGNILIEPDGAGNSQILHFGGDSGNEAIYRGTLYFWNNTIVSTRTGNTTLIRLSTNAQTADIRNNIIYVTATGNKLALTNEAGVLYYGWNLFKPGFVTSHGTVTGSVVDLGGNITAASPGFMDENTQDFRLTAVSPARNAAGTLPPETAAYTLDHEYLKDQALSIRQSEGTADIGALEYNACGNLSVRINNMAPGYTKIQDAYYAASSDQTLYIQDGTYLEHLFLNASKTIELVGGYSCDFSTSGSHSAISGSLTITEGTVMIDRLTIR